MDIKFKKSLIMRVFFFAGRPEEKANLVGRTRYHGSTLLVMPNTYFGRQAKEGEEWRVAIDTVEYDPAVKSARTYCRLIAQVGSVESLEIGTGRKSPFRAVRPVQNAAEAARTVSCMLAPKPTKRAERRKHGRSELDRQLRQKMKGVNPPADKHGHRQKRRATA